jgi:MFS transporter, ACS family, tartrate transporter
MSADEDATILRRVTLRLVPFLMVCYLVSFLDRVNVGFAALDMVRDLRLSRTAFGLGGGLFFVTYFLFEVPSNLLLEAVGARRWIARIMITWGIAAAAMAAVTGELSFCVMRSVLGAAEAGFFPGVMLYITYWFPAAERARIIGLFTVAIPASSLLGSPLSAALLAGDGWLGLHGWQWMFIIEAAPAILLGLACLVLLEDGPEAARWLAPEQRRRLIERLRDERRRPPIAHLTLGQILRNRHVLILALVLAGSTASSSGIQLWQPQIIQAFGLTTMETGLLNAIPFAVATIAMVLWARHSDRSGERVFHTAAPLALTALSFGAAPFAGGRDATILILCLGVAGIYAVKGPAWALSTEWLSAETAAAGLAQINALSNLAGFATTYLLGFIRDRTGSFALALMPLVALAAAAALAVVLLGHRREAR